MADAFSYDILLACAFMLINLIIRYPPRSMRGRNAAR